MSNFLEMMNQIPTDNSSNPSSSAPAVSPPVAKPEEKPTELTIEFLAGLKGFGKSYAEKIRYAIDMAETFGREMSVPEALKFTKLDERLFDALRGEKTGQMMQLLEDALLRSYAREIKEIMRFSGKEGFKMMGYLNDKNRLVASFSFYKTSKRKDAMTMQPADQMEFKSELLKKFNDFS